MVKEPKRDLDVSLDEILIGGRESVEIVLSDYHSSWPTRFELERQRLRSALGSTAIAIEHIGSTAVPGLAAKPIIDVLVTVGAIEPDEDYRARLEAAGYPLRVREQDHRLFRTRARDVHVHIWPAAHVAVEQYLVLRDWLRHHEADRALYEHRKRQLAGSWTDMNDYADAKSDVIASILKRATWAKDQSLGPWAVPQDGVGRPEPSSQR